MGSFKPTTNDGVIPNLRVSVYLDGYKRSDVFCTSISLSSGVNGSTADFTIPSKTWDGDKKSLRGKFVQVYANYPGQSRQQVFQGYISSTTGDVSDNLINCQASSLIALSQTVYVGASNGYYARYPEYALRNGVMVKTNWTIGEILRDIISSSSAPNWRGGGGGLPSEWRTKLKLSSLSVFGTSTNKVPIGDIVFENTTLADALNQLLGIVGTVSFYEDFRGSDTYLKFYELANPSGPVKTVRIARAGEDASNTNVLTLTNDESLDDIRTRFLGVGDYKKYVVTSTTDHPTAPLIKGWDADLESAVLANPEIGKKGKQTGETDDLRQEYQSQYADVFRKFILPDVLRTKLIDKENAIETTTGQKLPVQVYAYPTIKTFDEETNTWAGTTATVPVLLTGVQFNFDEGYFILKDPAIDIVSSSVVSGTQVDVYGAIKIGITLTVNNGKLQYDTGNDTTVANVGGLSLQENIFNDSFGFVQGGITGLLDGEGVAHTFVGMVLDDTGWTVLDSIVIKDDSERLRYYTQNSLREKNRMRIGYSISTPFWTGGYSIGDKIRVVGQDDFQYGTHQISSVAYDLTGNHSVSISTDNSVPLISNSLLGGK